MIDYVHNVMKMPEWNTLYFYDFYPGYPANATTLVAASAALMERSFGNHSAFADSVYGKGNKTRLYRSFHQMVLEKEKSFLQGGFDYRFFTEAGKQMGRKCEALLSELFH